MSKKRKPTRLQALEAQVLWLTKAINERKETSIAIWKAIGNATTDVEIGDIVERLNELGNRCDSFPSGDTQTQAAPLDHLKGTYIENFTPVVKVKSVEVARAPITGQEVSDIIAKAINERMKPIRLMPSKLGKPIPTIMGKTKVPWKLKWEGKFEVKK